MHLKPYPFPEGITLRIYIFPKDIPKLKELYKVSDKIMKLKRRLDCAIATAPPRTQVLAYTVKPSTSYEED